MGQSFLKEVEDKSRVSLSLCYHCSKCSAGCPVAPYTDFTPNRLIRLIQYGQKKRVLEGKMLWLCASCQTCSARCPNDVDFAHVIDTLKEMAFSKKIMGKEKDIPIFHQIFNANIFKWGRLHELSLVGFLKMRTLNLFSDLDLGLKMFLKQKLPLLPHKSKSIGKMQQIKKRTIK